MSFVRLSRILLAASVFAALGSAQNLEATLARMDQTAKGFRSVSADVLHVTYIFVIKDKSEQVGKLQLYRPSSKDTRLLMEYSKPEPRSVAFASNKAEIYYPKRAEIEAYNFGKEARLVEEFLVLGFGSTSGDLRRSYDIKYSEQGNVGGVKADHLELTPKSNAARDHVAKIDMWIAQDGGYPVRLKVTRPSRDYDELNYTSVKVNPSAVTEQSVKLKPPKGVRKVNPQK